MHLTSESRPSYRYYSIEQCFITSYDIDEKFYLLGMYSFVLTVVDEASNQKLARRFVLFNNETSGPNIEEDNPIRVTSAEPDTNYQWITQVDVPSTPVELTWQGHFQSLFYQKLLIPIDDHRTGLIESGM